jgi:hypothetical protein
MVPMRWNMDRPMRIGNLDVEDRTSLYRCMLTGFPTGGTDYVAKGLPSVVKFNNIVGF